MEDLNKNKPIVGYDLHQNLKLYNVPFKFLNYLRSKHKNIIFKKITSEKNKSLKDIEIYFGNRITEKIIKKSPKLIWIHFGSIGPDLNDNLLSNSKSLEKKFIRITDFSVKNLKSFKFGYLGKYIPRILVLLISFK